MENKGEQGNLWQNRDASVEAVGKKAHLTLEIKPEAQPFLSYACLKVSVSQSVGWSVGPSASQPASQSVENMNFIAT